MVISLRKEHLALYRDIARLLVRYGQNDLLDRAGLADALDDEDRAEPHPGNVFITEDGRLALLDLGMVAHVAPETRATLLKLLLAVAEGRVAEAVDASLQLGTRLEDFDEEHLRREVADLVAQHREATAADIEVGALVMEISRISREAALRPPPELALLVRALLNLDEVGYTLDPDFDPNEAVRRHAAALMSRQMWRNATPGNVFAAALEARSSWSSFRRGSTASRSRSPRASSRCGSTPSTRTG